MNEAWTDGDRTLYLGDAWDLASQLEPESMDCLITSPPYWGLRDYGLPPVVIGGDVGCEHEWSSELPHGRRGNRGVSGTGGNLNPSLDESGQGAGAGTGGSYCTHCGAWRGQFGLEPHPQLYIDHLVDLFERLRPALKATATVWLNLGDSYGGCSFVPGDSTDRPKNAGDRRTSRRRKQVTDNWLRPKQLLGMPWRVAIAMQEAGWLLRNAMVWRKPNPMPSSVRDRLSCTYEHVFLFVKEPRYHFDLDAVREASVEPNRKRGPADTFGGSSWEERGQHSEGGAWHPRGGADIAQGNSIAEKTNHASGKNPGDVRTWPTAPFPEAHFATFPPALPEWCLRAGCPNEVCVECGKPKVRVVEQVERDSADYPAYDGKGALDEVPGGNGRNAPRKKVAGGSSLARYDRRDMGWEPTCSCSTDFRPGCVLDPFAGAGTVLCVAKEMGLRGIGFELSPEYVEMAGRRIEEWGLDTKPRKKTEAAEAAGQGTLELD